MNNKTKYQLLVSFLLLGSVLFSGILFKVNLMSCLVGELSIDNYHELGSVGSDCVVLDYVEIDGEDDDDSVCFMDLSDDLKYSLISFSVLPRRDFFFKEIIKLYNYVFFNKVKLFLCYGFIKIP